MHLHHGRAVVDVDDQARQTVALAVNQTVGVGTLAVGQAERKPQFVCLTKPLGVERLIDIALHERQHPHRDRPDLIVAQSHEIAGAVGDFDQIALLGLAVNAHDGTRENPRVEAQQTLFFPFF